MMRRAYTATTIAPAHVAAGAVLSAVLLVTSPHTGGPAWLDVVSAVLVMVTVVHLATVRLSVGGGYVVLGQGPWPGRGRSIEVGSVADARVVDLGWAQTFGVGPGALERGRITRMSPRPGPALVLTLRDGERVIISARHPHAALALLPTTATTEET